MTNQEFINVAKFKAQQWLAHNAENADGIRADDIFVVWYSKTLQNRKALLGTRFANYYFECTYNGDKEEMYMDVYDKLEKQTVSDEQLGLLYRQYEYMQGYMNILNQRIKNLGLEGHYD